MSPVLVSAQYVRRGRELESNNTIMGGSIATNRPDVLSWSDFRSHKLLDSSLSGAAAGGLLNGWRSGRRAIVPGITTGAFVCGLLQLIFNEVGVTRIKYLSQPKPESSMGKSSSTPQLSQPPSEPVIPFVERIMISLGLHKLSDEEYLKRLKQTRDGYLQQIKKLEDLEKERGKERKDGGSHSNL